MFFFVVVVIYIVFIYVICYSLIYVVNFDSFMFHFWVAFEFCLWHNVSFIVLCCSLDSDYLLLLFFILGRAGLSVSSICVLCCLILWRIIGFFRLVKWVYFLMRIFLWHILLYFKMRSSHKLQWIISFTHIIRSLRNSKVQKLGKSNKQTRYWMKT